MTSTRSQDELLPLIGKPRDGPLSQVKLPTNRDVILRLFYHMKVKKQPLRSAVNIMHEEVIEIWKKVSTGATPGYSCYISKTSIKNRINTLYNDNKEATNASRGRSASHHKDDFLAKLDKLFDISRDDIQEKLSPDDYKFLQEQKTDHKFTFGGRDKSLEKRLLRKRVRKQAEEKRAETSAKVMALMHTSITGSIEGVSSSDLESAKSTDDEAMDISTSSTVSNFVALQVPRKVASVTQVVEAADRFRLSNNALNGVIAALIRASNGNVHDFILSTSSTLRARQHVRQKAFQDIKTQFKDNMKCEFLTIHWDEKLLKEGRDLAQTEHIAVLASYGKETKLLGTTSLQSGTGLNQTEAIKVMLTDWEIETVCIAMCFDTTASNTGRFSGACILLEAFLGHSLLWTACRHHMHEIILSSVFKEIFGSSSSPKVEFFDVLKKKWPLIDTKQTTHMQSSTFSHSDEDLLFSRAALSRIKSDSTSYIPRDDYEELLHLCIYYIDKEAFQNYSFRRPGAQHRARWMSSAIYAMKIILLQNQLDLEPTILEGLQKFGMFVSVFYAVSWFQSPLASEAAVNDLRFYKKMLKYKSIGNFNDIANVAMMALKRHEWYLTEELIPFALFSNQLSENIKENIAQKLYRVFKDNHDSTLSPQKPIFPNISESTEIVDLIGERSVLIFQRLKFSVDDIQFLRLAYERWSEFGSYTRLENVVSNIKVVNDVAERGVKIMEDYKDILTHDPEQRNLILQCVEDTRKRYPDFQKTTLAGPSFSATK